ncbi:MAG: patatin-like phospholipase family protein [Elusimicrobiota bacterium]
MKRIKILSIDGGGIRGIIPAMVLAEIERRTKKRIAGLCQLVAGTSTGGILALGVTKSGPDGKPQFSAEDMVQLYEKEGKKIFSRTNWQALRSLGNLANEKYPARGLEAVLEKYFGQSRLKDALLPVVISSYEIERCVPFFFKSERAKKDPAYDFPIKQVARATSAAPTYFEPMKINLEKSSDYYALIDGGVFANNPAMCGYVEAKVNYPGASDFLLFSLGTGELTRPLFYPKAKNWGLAQWAQPLLDVVFDGVSDTVDYQLQQLLPPKNNIPCYYRFQTRLNQSQNSLDEAMPINIRALKLSAQTLISENNKNLDILCEELVK